MFTENWLRTYIEDVFVIPAKPSIQKSESITEINHARNLLFSAFRRPALFLFSPKNPHHGLTNIILVRFIDHTNLTTKKP